jgi:hypothetical protein
MSAIIESLKVTKLSQLKPAIFSMSSQGYKLILYMIMVDSSQWILLASLQLRMTRCTSQILQDLDSA